MKKVETKQAMAIIGGAMGCVQVYNQSILEGKLVCNITVACQDKWGNTTTSSKQVDMAECA